ncbi:MICOS complex subunit Mic10-like [Drosophila sulfurigaster albostrigata]|uniref:MICOS complex subunit MIC10 n=1 Tax=Drosophila albomicans TaxID=7291 RepID=A0A6P8XRX1_DROAB|nr:MICOS complex subunit Mic10-like [Drosophila albomicans]XP_060645421.1 MICOS complex subunit Mic10-like [Drosophila nasuta]XP_062121557.1 MICOS complex subunit Mic10-like [Drosophila sulfurigaster albostrigata]
MPATEVVLSEDKLGKKLDQCISDTIVKGCGGLVIGSVASLLFFKRRVWPAFVGTGFGVGVAYSTCEKSLNSLK